MLNLNPTDLPAAVRALVQDVIGQRPQTDMIVDRILAWHQGQLAEVTAAGLGRQFKRDGIIGDERAAYSRLEAERDHLRADLDATREERDEKKQYAAQLEESVVAYRLSYQCCNESRLTAEETARRLRAALELATAVLNRAHAACIQVGGDHRQDGMLCKATMRDVDGVKNETTIALTMAREALTDLAPKEPK